MDMDPWAWGLLLSAAWAIGLLIGAVGIGGVLLVPVLAALVGLSVHEAMATALAGFIATGIVGTWLFQRRGSIAWELAIPVCLGAVVFAVFGAFVNAHTSASALVWLIAALILFSGTYGLVRWEGTGRVALADSPRGQRLLLVGVGAFAGFGAGLTGVGGPALSVPLMMLFGFPVLGTVGVAQVLQIVAAGFGTLGNLMFGTIRFDLLGPLVVCQVLGVFSGVALVHAVDPAVVRRAVAALCVLVGALMMLRESGVLSA
jgi:uncharacterized protein